MMMNTTLEHLRSLKLAGMATGLKAEIEHTDSDWDREKLQERLAFRQ